MVDDTSPAALDRIDRAIARIEAATAARALAGDALAQRHDVLRGRLSDAITALDDVIANGSVD